MSRIGKNPVTIPSGVTVEVTGNVVTVKGKLGELSQEFNSVDVKVEEGQSSGRKIKLKLKTRKQSTVCTEL